MTGREKQSGKVRLQFDFSQDAYNELEELRNELDVHTRAETVRYALRTLQWLIQVSNEGGVVLVKRSKEPPREIVFPFMKRRNRDTTPAKNGERVPIKSSSRGEERKPEAVMQHS